MNTDLRIHFDTADIIDPQGNTTSGASILIDDNDHTTQLEVQIPTTDDANLTISAMIPLGPFLDALGYLIGNTTFVNAASVRPLIHDDE